MKLASNRRWAGLSIAGNERATMINRFALSAIVLLIAVVCALDGREQELAYLRQGAMVLLAFLGFSGTMLAHCLAHPAPSYGRRMASIAADVATISIGLHIGDAVAAYLFPLYFWVILGYGLRFGEDFMAAAAGGSALGFGAVIAGTSFWRNNLPLSATLFAAMIAIPLYGALLLRSLAEAQGGAAAANAAKTQLLANISHELRTPLTAILGISAILDNSGLTGDQGEALQGLQAATGILLNYVESLLNFTRDEIKPEASVREPVDLYRLLIRLRTMLAIDAEAKGVRLGLCIDADTPPHILTEPRVLLEIIQNLGANAVKFTEKGAVAIHVGVRRRNAESCDLRVEVSDTGIGVSKEAQRRIFDNFTQADASIGRRFGGSGLGLAIARRSLEARGGRLGVKSALGEGARFWFELNVGLATEAAPLGEAKAGFEPMRQFPVAAGCRPQHKQPVSILAAEGANALALAESFALVALARHDDPTERRLAMEACERLRQAAAPASSAGEPKPGEPSLQNLAILLAEDSGVNRKVLDKILTVAGCRVTLAADGAEALDFLLRERFELVLMDGNMPRINGVEVAKLYGFAKPAADRAPILGLTADATEACRAQCLQAGMIDIVAKPVETKKLLRAIEAAVLAGSSRIAASTELAPPAEREICALHQPSLEALAALGGREFIRELAVQFITEGAQNVDRLTFAIEKRDLTAFLREAHALSSSAGNLGAFGLAGLCRSWRGIDQIILASQGGVFLAALRRQWAATNRALRPYLAAPTPS